MITFDEEAQKKKIQSIHEKEEEEVTQILSKKYGIPYANLSAMTIDLDYLKLIPEEKSREGKIAVFQGVGKKIQVAIQNPKNELAQSLQTELGEDYQIQPFLVSSLSLEKAWEKYKEIPEFIELSKGIIDISPERIEEFLTQTTSLEQIKKIFSERVGSRENRRVSELLEIMLSGSLGLEASDIHIEPHDDRVSMRVRLDGVLHDVLDFDLKAYQLLLSRIKLVSEMKLNIREKAQDGRFSIKANDVEIEVRVSVIPSPYGESVVLRVLNPKSINVEFGELGIEPGLLEIIKNEIKKPNGMILTTGPTGSGKTTTLYSFLKEVRTPEVKIITIEEPVEYHLDGITQTQTKPKEGYTFATGLRSILRQDPDIIMVGEIRDLEAATIALNAALTGHLVFSTLHTNDAAGTIPRLIELGANPTIIAPAINLAMAQRLVRKICESCRKEYKPTEEEKKIIKKYVETFPGSAERPSIENLKLFKGDGCKKCSGIGYKGRIGVFEAIKIDEKIEQLILKNPSESEIKRASAEQNIFNMQQDAVLKIIKGLTTLEEAQRVIELS